MKKMIIAAAMTALALGSANAADLDDTVADVFSWGGFYVGATAGAGFGDYRQYSASGLGVNVDVDGAVFGGTAGYNFQFDQIVFGIEADYQTGPDGTTAQGTAGPFWSCNTGVCNVDIESFGTVRARLGFAQDNWLVYGTGGFAFGKVSGGILNSAQQSNGSSSETGYAVGGGVEWAFNQNWSAKLEYLHVDLGDVKFGTGIGAERFLGRGDFDVVRVGINYRF